MPFGTFPKIHPFWRCGASLSAVQSKGRFQGAHRTILGHPKHVLHLVLSPNAIAKAFNVMQCIGLSAPLISDFGLFWANVKLYNRSKFKDF